MIIPKESLVGLYVFQYKTLQQPIVKINKKKKKTGLLYSEYGGFPVAISIIVHPMLQISAYLPCPVYLITSGAIQFAVPRKEENFSLRIPLSFLELPKSASLQMPYSFTRIFAPLISYKQKIIIIIRWKTSMDYFVSVQIF